MTVEKASRAKNRRLSIYASQLRALGITIPQRPTRGLSATRCYRRPCVSKSSCQFSAYLELAERWLLQLQEANQHVQNYPPNQPFSEMCWGQFWLKVLIW
jgi:hypothetical protein